MSEGGQEGVGGDSRDLPASFEVRNATPAIFNGWPGSSLESGEMALLLDSGCPVTLPGAMLSGSFILALDRAKGPVRISRQQACLLDLWISLF